MAETIDFLEFYAREALRLAEATHADPVSRRAQRTALHSAGRGRGDSAVELSLRHHGGHDGGGDRHRQHGDPEALERLADHCREVCRGAGRGGNAGRRGELLPRLRRDVSATPLWSIPKTRFIAFTGSKAVGLDIHERAAKTQPGQIWIKRTILEMGGKDSILVCADADLDAAVDGVVASAFGFSGQKCSACSRAIVEAPIYDVFVERVRERVAKLTVGDPATNPNHGPGGERGGAQTRSWATSRPARRKAG